jgi:hypothetical protein
LATKVSLYIDETRIGDLENKRQVTTEEGKKFAAENDLEFMETSAKSSTGVDSVHLVWIF